MKLVDISGKTKKYMKAKIDQIESNSKNKNIKDLYWVMNDFKKGYQFRTNVVKDEKGAVVTDSQSILAK